MTTEAEQILDLTNQVADLTAKLDAASKNTPADLEAKITAAVAAAVADAKTKIDGAYKARDEALSKAAEAERKHGEEVKARLTAEGKHKEVADMQAAEREAKIKDLEKSITELTRNNEVRQALAAFEFRNENAANLAFKEVTAALVKNDQGVWTHASGKSIKDYVTEFGKDTNQSFLFKPKTNSGGGSGDGLGAPDIDKWAGKKLSEIPQEIVIQMAAAGKLPPRS